jgi:hypothetical protein
MRWLLAVAVVVALAGCGGGGGGGGGGSVSSETTKKAVPVYTLSTSEYEYWYGLCAQLVVEGSDPAQQLGILFNADDNSETQRWTLAHRRAIVAACADGVR